MTNLQNKPELNNIIDFSSIDTISTLPVFESIGIGASFFSFQIRFDRLLGDLGVSRKRRKEYHNLATKTSFALNDNVVSKYQYSCLRKIVQVLSDAKILHDENILSSSEFLEIIFQLWGRLFQKLTAIVKAANKSKMEAAGLNKNSLSKLRAELSSLQNEN